LAKVFSAGIVLYRWKDQAATEAEVLLVHPGGPFWANKDTHGWSIPKGEFDPDSEDPLAAAEREFEEELGSAVPSVGGKSNRIELPVVTASSKRILAWLAQGDFDTDLLDSNSFEMEWPPKSGQLTSFPEVDRAAWFTLKQAKAKLHKGQAPFPDLIRGALNITE